MKHFSKILFLVLLTAHSPIAGAQQNLVPNPSFELKEHCPIDYGDLSVANWISPTLGTPDYLHSCNGGASGMPSNVWGNQYARTGDGYAGIFAVKNNNASEYVQCKLINPLDANALYYVKFYVSRGDSNDLACDNIGAYFSTSVVSDYTPGPISNLPYTPQIVSTPNTPITNATDWIEISGIYIATGGEQYLTIGIFAGNAQTNWDTIHNDWQLGQTYYYIDDVCVSLDSSLCLFSNECNLKLPSAFSPNGDNTNDEYMSVLNCNNIEEYTMHIYNRWGQLVFDTNDYNVGWNGKYKNEEQPVDVYVVYVSVAIYGKTITKSASITLLR